MPEINLHDLFEYRNGQLFWKSHYHKRLIGRRAGKQETDGYWRVKINNTLYQEHRLVWRYFNSSVPDILDHINGDRADNRIENLRPASAQQNGGNARLSKTNTSGARGVQKHYKKWKAVLQLTNRGYVHLGVFNTIEEAKECYDKTAREWFGEFYSDRRHAEAD